MNPNEETKTPDLLAIAKSAIAYTLCRIRDNENIRWHMGDGTEAFSRLVKAQAAFDGKSEAEVSRAITSLMISRKSDTEILRDIRDVVDGTDWEYDRPAACIKIKTLLGR